VNLVLFDPAEIAVPLPRADPRARHIVDVLHRREGGTLDIGVVNGPRGKATLASLSDDALDLSVVWDTPLPPLPTTTLLIGLPRPQTARDILRDATTLGATQIHFLSTERADPNYAASTLWTSGEWRRHCMAGAAQAFDTRIPEVTWTHPLAAALATLPAPATRLALDNYEATVALRNYTSKNMTAAPSSETLILALGPERGWGAGDRAALREAGFTLAHLGSRVLRVETAVIAALSLTRLG
jgi:RsmE family RNA methyltransferase